MKELRLLSSLVRTSRTAASEVGRTDAYGSAVRHARAGLARVEPGTQRWFELFNNVLGVYGKARDEANAVLEVERALSTLEASARDDSAVRSALECALRSSLLARQSRAAVALYIFLCDRESAVRVAFEIDLKLAEATLTDADSNSDGSPRAP